ncbi:MAG: hypothetical protein ACKV19_11470 [Verrucomicrobiales bacterium]
MKSHRLASLLAAPVLVASSLPLATSAVAQDPSLPPAAQANGNDPFSIGNPPSEKRFDLEISADLPVEEAIAQVSLQSGQPVNVVWTGNSAQARLPALRLHQVTVRELLNALTAAGRAEQQQGRPGYTFQEVEGASNIFTFTILPALKRENQANSSSTRAGGGGAGSTGPAHPSRLASAGIGGGGEDFFAGMPMAAADGTAKTSEFFDLQPLLNDDFKVEDLTTAIRTAWTEAGDEATPPPSEALRYHQETQLLIATGHREQLAAVRSLIDLLKTRYAPTQDDKD